MNRGAMRELVRKRLGETTAVFWQDTELNSWLNYGGHDVAHKTKAIVKVGTLNSIEDQSEYSLLSSFPNILDVKEVYFYINGDTWYKLKKTSRDNLNVNNEGWKNWDSGTPYKYYFEFGRDKTLGILPAPDEPNSFQGVGTDTSDYIQVYYADDYTDISTDNSADNSVVEGFNQTLQLAMVDFAVAYGYESRGYLTKANDAWNNYGNRIGVYLSFRDKEDEEDEGIVMKPYRSVR